MRPGVLPLEPVALPADVGAGPRLPQDRSGQLVPGMPDGVGQRTGRGRPLRALRRRRRDPGSHAVVLPGHRLRRAAARGPGQPAALVRARQDDAAQLDRALRGRRDPVRGRRARRADHRLHDAARHAPWGELPRARAGASRRRAAGEGVGQSGCDRAVRGPCPARVAPRAGSRGRRQGRPGDGRLRGQSGHRRENPGLAGELRSARVRNGRDHGRSGPRPARLRIRAPVWPSDPPGLPDRGRGGRSCGDDRADPPRRVPLPVGRVGRHAERSRGHPRRHPVAGAEGRGQGKGRIPAARLAHLAAALLGNADSRDSLSRLRSRARAGLGPARPAAGGRGVPGHRGQSAREVRGVRQRPLPALRRCGAPRDGHDGHVRRLLLVLPAVSQSPRCRADGGHGAREALAAGRPVHRGHRARHPAPALRAVHLPGVERHGPRAPRGAVRAPLQPGDDHAVERGDREDREDVQVARQHGFARRADRALRRRHRAALHALHRTSREGVRVVGGRRRRRIPVPRARARPVRARRAAGRRRRPERRPTRR